MRSVLVLGATGMLGSMVHGYLKRNPKFSVTGTSRASFDAEKFVLNEKQAADLDSDYIIHCIGVIKPYCRANDPIGVRKAITINSMFPHLLAQAAKKNGSKVIQIATDCVYSGAKGNYVESDAHDALDVYGKSKSLGEVFDGSMLNIRCSIIGPELKNHFGLFDWFLRQKDGTHVDGYFHHRWNGVTTLQFAKLCEKIIEGDSLYEDMLKLGPVHHFTPNSNVSKFELLCLISKIFGKNVAVKKADDIEGPVDRTLATLYPILCDIYPRMEMKAALIELQQYLAQR